MSEVGRSGDDDRDMAAWMRRVVAVLTRLLVETVYDGSDADAETEASGNGKGEG